jgi:hypothetical protein
MTWAGAQAAAEAEAKQDNLGLINSCF